MVVALAFKIFGVKKIKRMNEQINKSTNKEKKNI